MNLSRSSPSDMRFSGVPRGWSTRFCSTRPSVVRIVTSAAGVMASYSGPCSSVTFSIKP